MTSYDAAMVGVIIAGMVWGAFRGITWQLASILSLVLGYSVSQPLSTQLAPSFPGDPVMARGLAMIAVYFAVAGGVFLVAWMVRKTLRRLQFEAFDRHLGMVLGGLEGALIGLVATLFVVSLAPKSRDPIFGSPTGRVVGQLMSTLGPVLPEEARGVLSPFWAGTSPGPETGQGSESLTEETAKALPTPLEIPRPQAVTSKAGAPRDGSTNPASLGEFLEQSQREIGKAVIDGAAEGLRRAATKGENVHGRDGTTERR